MNAVAYAIIFDYYIENNMYSDLKDFNEAHPWSKEEIKKFIRLDTVEFFANYSEKGYMINHVIVNKYDPDDRVIIKESALMAVCNYEMSEIALALIATGKSNPGVQDKNDRFTALILACCHSMTDVAIALIKTGESNPRARAINNRTALISACGNIMKEVALALIATGESNPAVQETTNFNTALIYACYYGMTEVALAILATGNCNALVCDNEHDGIHHHDALHYAKTPELKFWIRREQAYERRRYLVVCV